MANPGTAGGGSDGPSLGEVAGFGLQFVVAILVFLYLGRWVDGLLGTAPTFLLIGVFVGAGGAFYSMYRKVSRSYDQEPRNKGSK